MSTVGQLLILITGNNAALTAALATSRAEMSAFSASTGAQGAVASTALRNVGVAAGLMAGAVVVGGALSVKAAADFQDQLAIINTIAHQTPEELNATGEAIRAMALSTGEPLSDLTQGFYDLLSANVPVNDAMGILELSSTLAIGGLATTAQTVDLLTTAMNTYGLTPAQVAVATDQFALAVQHGKVHADQIAATFADVAPIAKTAGIGIDEIAAAYAVMTSAGVPAAEVTTQMNRAILELLKPGADLLALQEQTGINFAELAGEQGLVVALQAMREAAEANGVPFQDLFGRMEGYKFALATTGPEFAKYRDELALMGDAGGTAAEQAAERMDTLNRQLAILGTSIGDLGIQLGGPLLTGVTDIVKGISGVVQGVTNWARENPALAGTILPIAAGVLAIAAAIAILGPVIATFGTILAIAFAPVTLVIAAIALIGGALGVFGSDFQKFVLDLFEQIAPKGSAARLIIDALAIAFAMLGTVMGAIKGALDNVIASLQSIIDLAGRALEGLKAIPGVRDLLGIEDIPKGSGGGLRERLAGEHIGIGGYASGGVVPGPMGSPQLAVVHGGETITPPGQAGGAMELTTHTHVHIDGREIAEVVERILLDNAMGYSSGMVSSPVT